MRTASRHSGKRHAETQYSAIGKNIEAEESSSASQKGTRRTASLPAWAMRSAHCPLRLGHCPLRQRIVRMPIIIHDELNTPIQHAQDPASRTPRTRRASSLSTPGTAGSAANSASQ